MIQTHPEPTRSTGEVRIVLCMIVKDEGAVLGRCLESALPHTDGYVICDTGSSDNTVQVIEETASRFGVAGRVVRHAWRNFGHNRTQAAREARSWVEEAGWSRERTYLLFLDADMVLHVDASFEKRFLTADYYDVIQDNGVLRYANTRLACLSYEWVAVGATHEYWQPVGAAATSARLETMHIQDLGDGGSKSQKYERDISLLREELAQDPTNTRHTFYLAQSYFDIGRWSEAAEWYHRRWKLGGWDEERWFARYREGLCMLRLGDDQRGAGVLLEAFDERPTRAEPLWALACHYRDCGRNNVALMFAMRGLELAYPGDVLFVEKQVYEWQLWEEVMISAYYAGARYHDLGLSACERLLARRGHDSAFYNYVANNETFYLPTLEGSRGDHFTVPRAFREPDWPSKTLGSGLEEVEQNGLLWSRADGLHLICSYDPFVVLRVDTETGETEAIHESVPSFRAAAFRGSCAPLPFPDGSGRWIALIHEVAARASGRVYSHRWIEIDEEAGLVGYSRPFVFDHVGIEYATGLCDPDGERLIVTYGFDDREARWIECPWTAVIAALRTGESQPRAESALSAAALVR